MIKSKDEVLTKFEEYVTLVENQTGHKVKTFVTVVNNKTGLKVKILIRDNGGEYTSKAFASFCAAKGIIHQFTNPYSPEQNGIAERLNHTIVQSARSMLLHASLPQQFWAEAVNTAVYLHNQSPTVALTLNRPGGGAESAHRLVLSSAVLKR